MIYIYAEIQRERVCPEENLPWDARGALGPEEQQSPRAEVLGCNPASHRLSEL